MTRPAVVLQGHLERDLDADGPRVGEEHPVETGHGGKTRGERDCRLMGEAAEHHVRHPAELRPHRFVQCRVPVAVHDRPPRRHRIDDRAPVRQVEVDARGVADPGERAPARCRVRVPHVVTVSGEKVRGGGHGGFPESGAQPP